MKALKSLTSGVVTVNDVPVGPATAIEFPDEVLESGEVKEAIARGELEIVGAKPTTKKAAAAVEAPKPAASAKAEE